LWSSIGPCMIMFIGHLDTMFFAIKDIQGNLWNNGGS
jgi:hypothetical protein